MVGLIFHVLYLFGKCIYDKYYVRKTRFLPDTPNEAELFMPDYDTLDDVAELENTSWWTHHTINNFFPPAYIQRYCAVSNVLMEYKGKLHKIVDFGCAELGFLVYMKAISEVQEILCVDIDREVLERHEKKASPLITEMLSSRERKLTIEICEGSVTDNDIKLKHANAVICIELIEHLYPDTLIDLPFNIFGYIKPEVAIITTPNVEFNIVFPNLSGYRHPDHKFEWTRKQFQDWAQNIVERYPYYSVTFHGIANGTEGTEEFGALTQMAVFHRILPRDQSRIEILIPDEYIRLKGQHNLFNTIAKYNYSTGSDSRTDEQKILDDAVYYIHFLSNNINDENSEVHLDRLLKFMDKYTLTIETLRSILTDAGWNIEDREEGPVLLPSFMHSDDESEFDDYLNVDSDDWNNEYGNSDEEYDFVYKENTLDGVHYPSINEIPAEPNEYVPQQDTLTENWNEESNVIYEENRLDVTNSSINEMSMDANEYLTEQNLDTESWHDNPNFTNEGDRWNYRSSIVVVNEIPADTNEEYSSAQDPHIENWHEESSIIIPENCSINQEYTYLFDGENSLVGEDSCTIYDIKHSGVRDTAESLAYTERELPSDSIPLTLNEVEVEAQETLFNMSSEARNSLQLKNSTDNIVIESAQNDKKDLKTMQETSTLNFQYRPVSRSSTSPVSLYFSSEHLSLQDFSTSYQNRSSINDQCLLNTTFHQSEIATEEAINSKASIEEDISCSKENLLVKDIQKSFSLHMRLPNCNTDERNISDENQICEDGGMTDMVSPDAHSNILNDQPKYTSSPLTKISAINNIVDKSSKKRELIPAMNSNVLLGTTKEIKETILDTIDSNLLGTSQKSNSITETIKLNATSSSSDVTNIPRDVEFSTSNSTLQRLCVKDKECSIDNSIPTNLIQDTNQEFVKNDIINHESDIPNADAHDVLSLDSESINHKNKTVYSTPAKANHIDVKAHLENLIGDLAQSSIRKNGLNPPTELLSSKSQNVSKYSLYDCAKESSILKNNKFVPCKSSEDTSNVYFTSVLRSEENIGTSKDVSNIAGSANIVETKSSSPLETPPSSWSPEIMDSGYPNSASAQDITPEYDLSSIAQDHIPDSESPSIAEAPRIGVLEPIEVENGDLANNNRDDEGNNMMAVDVNDIENLQPFIDVLENDLENENDIYIMQNGFPVWLLRILDMANPFDFDIQARQDLRIPDEVADDANYVGHDEGFDSSSSESESDVAYNGVENNAHDE
ncbi:uncharacterized protein LOC105835615 [Monomorium pharaonis]|uniref:uncharacterized protein LOC105835615 n=1 Tax=Monomorium pharaonis TaxID=307658 RepID=UPI00063EF056|nr:uncharacterized protein LOC105835615 [Monomorium pharaonis]